MRQLNRTWRNIDAPTDVLSFPMLEEGFDDNLLGDVVICLPVAEKQAKEYGHGLSRGACLFGCARHFTPSGPGSRKRHRAEMMEREQEALLDSMGLRR